MVREMDFRRDIGVGRRRTAAIVLGHTTYLVEFNRSKDAAYEH
jgi:hypothetical protein